MSEQPKEILFDDDARNALRQGIEYVAHVVAATLGPRGHIVQCDASPETPILAQSGYGIAAQIVHPDPLINVGAAFAKEVAAHIQCAVGDGTTTGILLFNALVQEGMAHLAIGANALAIQRGLEKSLALLLHSIDRQSTPLRSPKELHDISSHSEQDRSKIERTLTVAYEQAGTKGTILVQEADGNDTCIEAKRGLQIAHGYISPYFCTDPTHKQVELLHPLILLTDQQIASPHEMASLLQHVASVQRPILIVAKKIEPDALSTLIANQMYNTLRIAAIDLPLAETERTTLLHNLASLTGATLISPSQGLSLRTAHPDRLGNAERVIMTKQSTTIIGHNDATSMPWHDNIILLRVGAPTDAARKHNREIYQHRLNAINTALAEGIVPGGGLSLLTASRELAHLSLSKEESVGKEIIAHALTVPFRHIVMNAGHDPSIHLTEVFEKGTPYGFNAMTETVEDVCHAGIFDATRVMKASLRHAVCMANRVLLSDALIQNHHLDEM